MNTKEVVFDVDKLNFSTLDASEREFFTIEYDDPNFVDALGILGGKTYLMLDDSHDKFSVGLWIEGEPVMELDEQTREFIKTGVEKEPYYIEYKFTPSELDSIKLRLIEYMHCLIYAGKQYALVEMMSA